MKVGDSRITGGPGILPLQHAGYVEDDWPLWNRAGVQAVRLLGRFDNSGGTVVGDELGWWEEDPETRGDVIGGQFWQRTSRDLGAWRFAWPVRTAPVADAASDATTTGDQSLPPGRTMPSGGVLQAGVVGARGAGGNALGAFGIGSRLTVTVRNRAPVTNMPGNTNADGSPRPTTGSPGGGACAHMDTALMIPVKRGDWEADDRLTTVDYKRPEGQLGPLWPKLPIDWFGISLQADHENEQEDLFYPTDPRMVAVHCHGDEEMGSLVCEMGDGFRVDEQKMARLQSAWKVAKRPAGCGINSANPTLSWNIGLTGCKDSVGGLVWEQGSGTTGAPPAGQPTAPRPTTGGSGGTVARVNGNIVGGTTTGAGNRVPGSVVDGGTTCPSGVYGHVSQRKSGFIELDCGANHKIGSDGDGNDIFAAHLSLNSYFTFPSGMFDGPLKHDGAISAAPPAPYPVDVQFGYDPTLPHPFVCGGRLGKQRWRAGCFMYSPPTDTPKEPPPPGGGPPGEPGTPGIPVPPSTPGFPIPGPVVTPIPGGELQPFGPPERFPGGGELQPFGPPERFPPQDGLDEFIDRPPQLEPDVWPPMGPDDFYPPGPSGELVEPIPPTFPDAPGGVSDTPSERRRKIREAQPQAFPRDDKVDLQGNPISARERLKWDRLRPGGGSVVSGYGASWSLSDGGWQSSYSYNSEVYAYTPDRGMLPFAATTMETAFPAFLARPAMVSKTAAAWKNWRAPSNMLMGQTVDSYTPITGRVEAWGAQGKKIGDTYICSPYMWNYTNDPETYRYRSGTASGGFLVLPPEVGMEDVDTDYEPLVAGASTSTTLFAVGPGARFGAGKPDLENGGLNLGYTWRDDAGALKWGTSWYSATTDRICFDSTGKVGIGEMVPTTDLHVKNSEVSPIDGDLVTIESSGDTTGDSFGIGFKNATGELAKLRCLQGALLGGRLQWQTTSTLGVAVRWMVLDERGKLSLFDSTYATKFSIDPIMDKFLTPDGSAADPAVSFTADDDTGSYRPGSDQWAVATGGIQKFYLDRFGNAGFNTTVFGSGRGVIGIKNAATAPSTTPLGGGVLYVSAGALVFKGGSGTVTTIAVA